MQTYDKVDDNIDADKKREYWNVAFGLQEVDGLKPSKYMEALAENHVDGKKSYYEVSEEIDRYYISEKPSLRNRDEREADVVSKAIYAILSDEAFSFDLLTYKNYHKRLFEKLDANIFHPGEFRKVNITKKEPILDGDTVRYQDYGLLEDSLNYDFNEEKNIDYLKMTDAEKLHRLSEFTSRIWQVHPFMEGNTRTTAVFIEKYLRSLGYKVDNEMFEKHSRYFRDALVRANYANLPKNIAKTDEFLVKFFENLLLGSNHSLNENLHI
ncbi:Fic family protein [Candidatus Saccharibacteria bacterium]|nr:Fic family protein [Candidatus Saccharibacteria bacterium]